MPSLPTDLFNEILEILKPTMDSADNRRAIVISALQGRHTYDNIVWSGSARAFSAQLIKYLPHVDLILILKNLELGVDYEVVIKKLCDKIEIEHQKKQQNDKTIRFDSQAKTSIYFTASACVLILISVIVVYLYYARPNGDKMAAASQMLDFTNSMRDESERSFVEIVTSSYSNISEAEIKVKMCDHPNVDAKITDLQYQERGYVDFNFTSGKVKEYPIKTFSGKAKYRAEISSASNAPVGIGYVAPIPIKDLDIEIKMPHGVEMEKIEETFYDTLIKVDGNKQEVLKPPHPCIISGDTQKPKGEHLKISCKDLNLRADNYLLFCFNVNGWQQDLKIDSAKTCFHKMRACGREQ